MEVKKIKSLAKFHLTVGLYLEHKMLVRSAKVLDEDGSEMYPINFRKPIIIVLEAENNGDVVSKDIGS